MSKRKIHKSKLGIIDFQREFNTEDKCREFLLNCVSHKVLFIQNVAVQSYITSKNVTHASANVVVIRPL